MKKLIYNIIFINDIFNYNSRTIDVIFRYIYELE